MKKSLTWCPDIAIERDIVQLVAVEVVARRSKLVRVDRVILALVFIERVVKVDYPHFVAVDQNMS